MVDCDLASVLDSIKHDIQVAGAKIYKTHYLHEGKCISLQIRGFLKIKELTLQLEA